MSCSHVYLCPLIYSIYRLIFEDQIVSKKTFVKMVGLRHVVALLPLIIVSINAYDVTNPEISLLTPKGIRFAYPGEYTLSFIFHISNSLYHYVIIPFHQYHVASVNVRAKSSNENSV